MVKPEIFGSRKSILKNYLENIKKAYPDIEIVNRLWLGTCLYKYNPNKKTRYIIFYECSNENEFNIKNINFLQEIFNPYIPILKVYIKGDLFKFFDIQYVLNTSNSVIAQFLYKFHHKALPFVLILFRKY